MWDFLDNNWHLTQTLGQVDNVDTKIGHVARITTVTLSNDGKRIASGAADHTIRIWDLNNTWHLTQTLGEVNNTNTALGHTKEVSSVAFSAADHHVISGSHDKTIRIWDTESINDFCKRLAPELLSTL